MQTDHNFTAIIQFPLKKLLIALKDEFKSSDDQTWGEDKTVLLLPMSNDF